MKGKILIGSIMAVMALAFTACSPGSSGSSNSETNNFNSDNNIQNNNNSTTCTDGQTRCTNYSTIEICHGGTWEIATLCQGETPFCDPQNPTLGCLQCVPNGKVCVGDEVHLCTVAGEIGPLETTCDPAMGQSCVQMADMAGCDSPCDRAAQNHDYQGCDYWAVTMLNPFLDAAFDSDFGIVVSNDNDTDVTVTIEKGGQQVVHDTVGPNSVKVFKLPFDADVQKDSQDPTTGAIHSGLYTGAAYHITTTLPVTVYQFNPYDFTVNGEYSYSNDGSLLLPTPVLSNNYIVMSRQLLMVDAGYGTYAVIPGVVTIVAAEDQTSVTLLPRSKVEGALNSNPIPALQSGQSYSVNMNAGDVLQIVTANSDLAGSSSCPGQTGSDNFGRSMCDPGTDYDLTGTEIRSNKPIAVWGGHGCDYVPFDSQACDHLEEMMFPLETWGKAFVVGSTHEIEAGNANSSSNVIRIMAGDNNVQVTFDPASVHSAVTLNRGEYMEFITTENFSVRATGPIMVGQFTVGQNYWTDQTSAQGDPAFGLVVPTEQYRTKYVFSAPESFEEYDPNYGASGKNYMNIYVQYNTDSMSMNLLLDGQPISGTPTPIGNSGWSVVKLEITGGTHVIESTDNKPFGIMVYGFAPYTSYLYPGGLDLKYINPVD